MLLQVLCIISQSSVNSNNYSPEMPNSDQSRQYICPVWPSNLTDDLWKQKGTFSMLFQGFVHHFVAIGQFKLELQSGTPIWVKTGDLFCPVWPWNLTDDLQNNRAPFLCCFKLCASFHSHQWTQTRVTVQGTPNLGENGECFVPCNIEIWRMTLKNNRASFLHLFKPCASYSSPFYIKAVVLVRKHPK